MYKSDPKNFIANSMNEIIESKQFQNIFKKAQVSETIPVDIVVEDPKKTLPLDLPKEGVLKGPDRNSADDYVPTETIPVDVVVEDPKKTLPLDLPKEGVLKGPDRNCVDDTVPTETIPVDIIVENPKKTLPLDLPKEGVLKGPDRNSADDGDVSVSQNFNDLAYPIAFALQELLNTSSGSDSDLRKIKRQLEVITQCATNLEEIELGSHADDSDNNSVSHDSSDSSLLNEVTHSLIRASALLDNLGMINSSIKTAKTVQYVLKEAAFKIKSSNDPSLMPYEDYEFDSILDEQSGQEDYEDFAEEKKIKDQIKALLSEDDFGDEKDTKLKAEQDYDFQRDFHLSLSDSEKDFL